MTWPRRWAALAPLRHRRFRLLAGGQLASNTGDAFFAVALPWYVLATHGGALLLGTTLAAYGIPRTATIAVGGAASDRWHPWTVMMIADLTRAAAVTALAVVAVSGPASAASLVPIAAILGAGEGLFLPGSMAIVPSLLPDDDLQAGNALNTGGTQLATLIGPGIGGALVALVGPSPAFAVDAASFAVSGATLAAIRSRQHPHPAPSQSTQQQPQPPRHPAPDTAEPAPATLRHLLSSERVLQVFLLLVLAANLSSGGMSEVALPALAHGPFHTGADGYGALIAAFAAGALTGTLAAAHLPHLRRPAIVASTAFLAEAACMAAIPYLGAPLPAGADLAVFGLLNGFGNIITITALQRWAPAPLMGRLMGAVMLSALGAFPLSVAAAGLVVHDLGPAAWFPIAAATLTAAILAGLTQPSWRHFATTPTAERSNQGIRATGDSPVP